MKKKILIIVIGLTFSLSCKNNTSKSISPTAKEYIDEVITLLEKALDTLADVVITKTEYNSISNAIDLFENKINNKTERSK